MYIELLQQEFGRPGGVSASTATMNPSNVLSNVPDSASQYHRALMESFSTAAATNTTGTGNNSGSTGSTGSIGSMKKATTSSGSIGGNSSTGSILPPAGMLGRPPMGASRGTKHNSPMSATATSQAQKRRKLSEYTDMYMQAMYQQQQQGMGGYHPPGYAMYPPPPSYEQLQYMEHQMRLASEHAAAVTATSPTAAASSSTGVLGSSTEQAGTSQESTTTTTTIAPTTSVPSSPTVASSAAPTTAGAPAPIAAVSGERTSSTTAKATSDGESPQLGSVAAASTAQLPGADNVSVTATTGMKNIPNSGSTVNTAKAGSVPSDAASVASGYSGRSSKGNTTASPRPNHLNPYSPQYPGMGVAVGGIPTGMPPELYSYYMQQMYNGGWPYLSGPGMHGAGLPPHILSSMQQNSASGYGISQAPQGQQHPSASQHYIVSCTSTILHY